MRAAFERKKERRRQREGEREKKSEREIERESETESERERENALVDILGTCALLLDFESRKLGTLVC